MKINKILKYYTPAFILLICILCLLFKYRIELIKNGYPFAKLQKSDIFNYITIDGFNNVGVVLSNKFPVGYISQTWTPGCFCFIPFKKGEPPFDLQKDITIDKNEEMQRYFYNFLFFGACASISLILVLYFIILKLITLKNRKNITSQST